MPSLGRRRGRAEGGEAGEQGGQRGRAEGRDATEFIWLANEWS